MTQRPKLRASTLALGINAGRLIDSGRSRTDTLLIEPWELSPYHLSDCRRSLWRFLPKGCPTLVVRQVKGITFWYWFSKRTIYLVFEPQLVRSSVLSFEPSLNPITLGFTPTHAQANYWTLRLSLRIVPHRARQGNLHRSPSTTVPMSFQRLSGRAVFLSILTFVKLAD